MAVTGRIRPAQVNAIGSNSEHWVEGWFDYIYANTLDGPSGALLGASGDGSNLIGVVHSVGDESIDGQKTFNENVRVGSSLTASLGLEAATSPLGNTAVNSVSWYNGTFKLNDIRSRGVDLITPADSFALVLRTLGNYPVIFASNSVEKARIDANGLTVTGAISATSVTAGNLGTMSAQDASNVSITGGSAAFTAPVFLSGAPTDPTQAANKQYVDDNAQGIRPTTAVRAASISNSTPMSGPATVDGVSLIAGDRFLQKDSIVPSSNGIYVVQSGTWTRATDMDTWAEVPKTYVTVTAGTQAGTSWVVSNAPSSGTLGTTDINWSLYQSAPSYSASGGITKSGSTFSLSAMAANTVKGNNTGSSAVPIDLNGPQLAAMLPSFGTLKGLVPGTTSSTTAYLQANGVFTSALTPVSVAATGNITGFNLSGTNTGDQTITLTGAIAGTGTGTFATTLSDNAVTLAKMADIATATILGRTTAGTGDPQALSPSQALGVLGIPNVENTALSTWAGSVNVATVGANIATGASSRIKSSGTTFSFRNFADSADLGISALLGRFSSNTTATLVSTGHAFQIGADAGLNIIADNNEVDARSSGAASTLFLNQTGGSVSMSKSTVTTYSQNGGGLLRTLNLDSGATSANDGPTMQFQTSGADGVGPLIGGIRGSTLTGASFIVQTGDTSQATRLRVWNSGGVSIGTSPSADPGAQNLSVIGGVSTGSYLELLPSTAPSTSTTATRLYLSTVDGTIHSKDSSGTDTSLNFNVFGGSGTGHSSGLVPDPGAAIGSPLRFLREDGAFAVPSGGGGGGAGTVTSVALAPGTDNLLYTLGGPVTGSGTLTVGMATSGVLHGFLASGAVPVGPNAAPFFRTITLGDLPTGYLYSDLGGNGSTSITTVGTITSGTWHGTAIGDTYISSASAWNAKENALTFSAPLARATNTISIPSATNSRNGYLTSGDWTTFNSKVGVGDSPALGNTTSFNGTRPTASFVYGATVGKGRVHAALANYLALTQNSFYTGSAWNLDDTSRAGWNTVMGANDEFRIERSPAGTNPVTPVKLMSINTTGDMTVLGSVTAASGTFSSFAINGPLDLGSAANATKFLFQHNGAANQYGLGNISGEGRMFWPTTAHMSFGTLDSSSVFSELFRVLPSGGINIGGTSDPGAGRLIVNGTITATNITSPEQAISSTSSFTGSTAPSHWATNDIQITSDNFSGSGGPFTSALNIGHTFGGSAKAGGVNSVQSQIYLNGATSGTNPNRNYVSGFFSAQAVTGDGGTLTVPNTYTDSKGSLFGLNAQAMAESGATGLSQLYGIEVDINLKTGATVAQRVGININDQGEGTGQGVMSDSAIAVSRRNDLHALSGSTGWRSIINLGYDNGTGDGQPLSTNGVFLRTVGTATISRLIDMPDYQMANDFMRLNSTIFQALSPSTSTPRYLKLTDQAGNIYYVPAYKQ